ncbi:MAG: galactokinase [Bacteroidota bacterium]
MELLQDTIDRYRQVYGTPPDIVVSAPGRVNLIGEHTDYNDGFVLPVAIDRNIFIAAGRRKDPLLNLHSVDLLSSGIYPLESLHYDRDKRWTNYPAGVAKILQSKNHTISGANFCIRGNIPIGAGLSSSAAFCVGSAIIFSTLNELHLSPREIITIAQQAEMDFVGIQCGIMDQFIAVMGKKNKALFLDCLSLNFEQVQFPSNVSLIICDIGSRRELANSAYNQRHAECEDAVRQLTKRYPDLTSLRDITIEQFRAVESMLSPVARKRALHVISENDRVVQSVVELKKNNLEEFGRLMIESHRSLKENYEVSSKELDAFVDIAITSKGVWGARMTGAGFGGSAICIVNNEMVDELVNRLRAEYPKRAGRSLTVYISTIEDGAMLYDPKHLNAPTLVG